MAQRAEPVQQQTEENYSVEEFGRDLNTDDRCDSCGAQALVRVLLHNGELMFCGHHFATHEQAVTTAAIAITDQRDRIEELV